MERWQCAVVVCALLTLAAPLPVAAAAEAGPATKNATETIVAESDDIRALVAPVALYPDPILALVLQASTLPLQVVQADRFLDKRAKDANLQPHPDWDKSIIGLLNYPRQVQQMAEYIDWTEELGNAVVDNLDEVQGSIQEIRLAVYHAGILRSNAQQKIEVKDGIIRISSTDPQSVAIPEYDPAALVTYLDDIEETEDAADAAEAGGAAPRSAASGQAGSAKQQTFASPEAPQQVPATAQAPTAAYSAPAASPVAPPTVVYGQPQDSFWSDAATFAGGAVVGGLLGWGLTEALNDDDDDDWWEDEDWDNDDVQEELRERREFREHRREDVFAARDERRDDRMEARQDVTAARAERRNERTGTREERAAHAREVLNERPAARGGQARPASGNAVKTAAPVRAERAKRDVTLPGTGKQAGVAEKVGQRSGVQQAKPPGQPSAAKLPSAKQKRSAAASGFESRHGGTGIAASTGNVRQVRREADRGASSRAIQSSSGHAPSSGGRGGGDRRGMVASSDRGGGARFDGDRGRASRTAGRNR